MGVEMIFSLKQPVVYAAVFVFGGIMAVLSVLIARLLNSVFGSK
jgi:hypothetical protein